MFNIFKTYLQPEATTIFYQLVHFNDSTPKYYCKKELIKYTLQICNNYLQTLKQVLFPNRIIFRF